MSLVLIWGMSATLRKCAKILILLGGNIPVVRIARMAGQFAK